MSLYYYSPHYRYCYCYSTIRGIGQMYSSRGIATGWYLPPMAVALRGWDSRHDAQPFLS